MTIGRGKFKAVAAAAVATLVLSLLAGIGSAQDDGGDASLEIAHEDNPSDECSQFVVEIRHVDSPTVNFELRMHRDGSAPPLEIVDKDLEGTPEEDGDGFRFEAGPFGREDTFNATLNFFVAVSWENGSLVSDFFDIQCPDGPPPLPDCPTNVEATALPNGTIRLTWDGVTDVDGYNVYGEEEGIPFAILGSSEDTVFFHEDTEPGTTFTYTVRADRGPRESIGCPQAEATAFVDEGAPPASTCSFDLTGEALPENKVRLDWTDTPGAVDVHVNRGGETIADLDPEDTMFLDEGLEQGQTYTYEVVVLFPQGAETCTVEVTAIPYFGGVPLLGALAAAGAVGAYVIVRRKV